MTPDNHNQTEVPSGTSTSQDIDAILKPFGYNPMFADREEIQEAFDFAANLGDALCSKPHVITAIMVYQNTLLRVLYHNGMLNLNHSPLHERIEQPEAENERLKSSTIDEASGD